MREHSNFCFMTPASGAHDDKDNGFCLVEASAAAEAVLNSDAILEKAFFLALCHWTHWLMLSSSSRLAPDLRPAGIKDQTQGEKQRAQYSTEPCGGTADRQT